MEEWGDKNEVRYTLLWIFRTIEIDIQSKIEKIIIK